MRTIFIYADFDWLEKPLLLGELGYESLRGSDSYSFKYDNSWLRQYGSLFLSADINNYPGNTHSRRGTSLAVSAMLCLTVGEDCCSTGENRFLQQRNIGLCASYLLLTIS